MISGYFHPPHSSEKYRAEILRLSEQRIQLEYDLGHQAYSDSDMCSSRCRANEHCRTVWRVDDLTLSPPLGRLPAKLDFPDGSQFIADESAQLQQAFRNPRGAWLHKLERHFPLIGVSFVALFLCGVLFFRYGMPWLTAGVVQVLPPQVAEIVGEQVLDTLDHHLLESSQLPLAQQAEIKLRFVKMVAQLPPLPVEPQLHFRRWQAGPNALALSDGSVIVFDSLVVLAQTPAQLDSILLHELGHIEHQHVMKSVVHSALLSASIAVVTGESTGLIDTFTGVGVFLASQGYSRDAEREADDYAAEYMLTLYGSTRPMIEMFALLAENIAASHHATKQDGELSDDGAPTWLSTHPALSERIERLQQRNELF
ncbi:hypothetical protein C9I91_18935 [Photobacterium jeanii]|nr:hypothetical protein C9I91_18935 [Photobacterium jeanii]